MSEVLFISDTHLGHHNIHNFRKGFSSAEEHHELVFDNIATTVGKRDTLFLCGDVAMDISWLEKIQSIACARSVCVVGNHDLHYPVILPNGTKRNLNMRMLCDYYDEVVSFINYKNFWVSHCPIHPAEMRNRLGNIHGHTHPYEMGNRYYNVCCEHTGYKPVKFKSILARHKHEVSVNQEAAWPVPVNENVILTNNLKNDFIYDNKYLQY